MYTITLLVPHRYLVTGDAITMIAYNFRIGVSTASANNFRCVYCDMGCFGINTYASPF